MKYPIDISMQRGKLDLAGKSFSPQGMDALQKHLWDAIAGAFIEALEKGITPRTFQLIGTVYINEPVMTHPVEGE